MAANKEHQNKSKQNGIMKRESVRARECRSKWDRVKENKQQQRQHHAKQQKRSKGKKTALKISPIFFYTRELLEMMTFFFSILSLVFGLCQSYAVESILFCCFLFCSSSSSSSPLLLLLLLLLEKTHFNALFASICLKLGLLKLSNRKGCCLNSN